MIRDTILFSWHFPLTFYRYRCIIYSVKPDFAIFYRCLIGNYNKNMDDFIFFDAESRSIYGDDNSRPAYAINGNLVATGYMIGLMEAAKRELGIEGDEI